MRFWIREIGGWLLIGIGLFSFYLCLGFLAPPAPRSPRPYEAGTAMIVGIIIFRGGIHLLKVAVAARICTRMAALPRPDDNGFPKTATASRPMTRPSR